MADSRGVFSIVFSTYSVSVSNHVTETEDESGSRITFTRVVLLFVYLLNQSVQRNYLAGCG